MPSLVQAAAFIRKSSGIFSSYSTERVGWGVWARMPASTIRYSRGVTADRPS